MSGNCPFYWRIGKAEEVVVVVEGGDGGGKNGGKFIGLEGGGRRDKCNGGDGRGERECLQGW